MKTIGVFISGGDTLGMNAATRTVVRIVVNKGLKVEDIMCRHIGLLEEEIVNTESTSVFNITGRGGATLCAARCKEFTTVEDQQKGADIHRKYGTDGMVVAGGDGLFRGTGKLPALGINIIGLLGTISLDTVCTGYIIGLDTAVNTAVEAIDKIRGTSTSHGQYSVVEVMGRSTGYIALRCGIGNGAGDILPPERYDGNEQTLINRIIDNRKRSKKHNTIINAEGIGHSGSMAKRIEVVAGIETRVIILGHAQRGGTSTCKDRVYTSTTDVRAVELLAIGKSNRPAVYKHDESVGFDIQEVLNTTRNTPEEQYKIAKMLTR